MTLQEFSPIFALLAVQLRFTDADEATIRGYFQGLQELEPELVAMAAQRLARVTNPDGQAWFPKTAEWRAMVAKVEADRSDDLKARLRKLPRPLCAACGDTLFFLNETTNRAEPCSCRSLRRLEILGRRPWPELPAAAEGDRTQLPRALALANEIATRTVWPKRDRAKESV